MAKKQSPNINNDVAILIPVYNEAKVVGSTINAIPTEFEHIICVDDGSSDQTGQELAMTRAKVVRHPINLGQGAALQTAIDYALLDKRYQYFVTYDADGQHRMEDVVAMLETIRSQKLDIVLGSRFLGRTTNITWAKKVTLKLAVLFTNMLSGVKLTDAHNGLRVFTRETAQKLQLTMADFAHASEIIERINSEKLTYAEVPVTITYTDYSRSKGQSVLNSINIAFDLLIHKLTKK